MKTQRAFTIVELVITVVIIGIIAGITVVVYRGAQDRARTTSLISDLDNAASLIGIDDYREGSYPLSMGEINSGQGLPNSGGKTSYQYTSDGDSFCITGTVEENPNILPYYVSSDMNAVKQGTCPGHYGPFIETGGVVTTLAGSGASDGYVDGTGSAARFGDPRGIAIGPDGILYVADSLNQRIRAVTSGGVVTTYSGDGSTNSFYGPGAIAVGQNGTLYIADTGNNRILSVTKSGVRTTLAGAPKPYYGIPSESGYVDGTGTAARFYGPQGIATSSDGTLYVADTVNRRIRVVTQSGVVTTLAGSGSRASNNGTGTAASFGEPNDIAIASDGTLYVSDTFNHNIRKITPAGVVTTLAGQQGTGPGGYGFADGTGTSAKFSGPKGIAVGRDGNIYVADTSNNRIRKITPAGVVTTIAGSAQAGMVDGIGSAAQFNSPESIVVLGDGTIYVGQTGNDSIRVIK